MLYKPHVMHICFYTGLLFNKIRCIFSFKHDCYLLLPLTFRSNFLIGQNKFLITSLWQIINPAAEYDFKFCNREKIKVLSINGVVLCFNFIFNCFILSLINKRF